MELQLRSATPEDVMSVQTLRKTGWQDNYVNLESGVTTEMLRTELAPLPVPQKDIDYYIGNIYDPEIQTRNIVAVVGDKVVGTVFYAKLENGNGDIGVFVDRDHRGQGIGFCFARGIDKAHRQYAGNHHLRQESKSQPL